MKRRRFLQAGSLALLSATFWARAAGANSRLGLAIVGGGVRGRHIGRKLCASGRAELRVICDVYDERRRLTREAIRPAEAPFETVAIEEALAHPKVDAVLVAAPDHLHCALASQVLAAKKHLYLEKPAVHKLEEHMALLEIASKSDRVLQTGTQQRSGAHYLRAKNEILDKDLLGKIVFVRGIWHNFPNQRRPLVEKPRPDGLDWERFLGAAPPRPFHWPRYDSWRLFRDYGGGQLSDILTHWVDVAQWFMNEQQPLDAVASGGIYQLNDGRENPDTVSAILRYGSDWNFNFECSILPVSGVNPHVAFHGTKGVLEISRDQYTYRPERGQPVEVKAEKDLDDAHTANWLDAIDNGTAPSAPLSAGLSACRAIHLAQAAYWTGKRTKYNAAGEIILEA
jgi:predicted dehydrogenase